MFDSELPVPVGDILGGRFRIENVIGVGGMGVVLEATHLELDQRVAIKLMRREIANSPEAVTRFIREARAAAHLQSDHVTRVYDVGRLPSGEPYMVMELLRGQDLSSILDGGVLLPVSLAVDYILEACEAIAEAHAQGIVHRDLKPANLFVAQRSDGSKSIKVLDFGISKATSPGTSQPPGSKLTVTGAFMGSPQYMSPEQLRETRNIDGRSDIWALGVILYEELTGRPPHDATSLADLCIKIAMETPRPIRADRPDVPPELERLLLMGALARDPAQRFPSVAHFAHALRPFASPVGGKSVDQIMRLAQQRASSGLAAGTGADARPGAAPGVNPVTTGSAFAQDARAVTTGPSGTIGQWDNSQASHRRRQRGHWALGAAGALVLLIGATVMWKLASHRPDGTRASATEHSEQVGPSVAGASASVHPSVVSAATEGNANAEQAAATGVAPAEGTTAEPQPTPSSSASSTRTAPASEASAKQEKQEMAARPFAGPGKRAETATPNPKKVNLNERR